MLKNILFDDVTRQAALDSRRLLNMRPEENKRKKPRDMVKLVLVPELVLEPQVLVPIKNMFIDAYLLNLICEMKLSNITNSFLLKLFEI